MRVEFYCGSEDDCWGIAMGKKRSQDQEDLRIKKSQRMNYRGAKLPRERGKVSTDGYPQTIEREGNDGIEEEVGSDGESSCELRFLFGGAEFVCLVDLFCRLRNALRRSDSPVVYLNHHPQVIKSSFSPPSVFRSWPPRSFSPVLAT